MLKKITVKAGLIALLSLMTLLLIVVSIIGVKAINDGTRSLQTLNQILGEELGSLANSSNLALRARTAASLAVRQREIGQIEVADASVGRIYGYLEQSKKEMARFVDVGTVTERGRQFSMRMQASYRAYLEQGIAPMAAAIKAGKLDDYYAIQENHISKLSIAFEADLSEFRAFAMEIGQQHAREAESNASTKIILPENDTHLKQVMAMGCWSEQEWVGEGGAWRAHKLTTDASHYEVFLNGEKVGEVNWSLVGEHNMHNGLMAIAATRHVGVQPADACRALGDFINARRRLELRGEANGVTVYDDFAHHPTAILATLAALRGKVGGTARILAVLEPRSNTMKMGISKNDLAPSLGRADEVFLFQPHHIPWQVAEVAEACVQPAHWSADLDTLVEMIVKTAQPGDHILVMSNGGFGGIHDKLLAGLANKAEPKETY
ncbi:UDP-N-acetylmuramate:L-alanyl-gamma-D-glutamyl-meso-diaminopimelate ligase [Serratia fonticola]|uniref:UDP-N-acetylmuramate:L-alanyl-gamma-D-glutamyl- meso-diaminopimelate ligase n=1 Tax=Serratia fonticola TaxID=47917 RepID=UPI003AB02192